MRHWLAIACLLPLLLGCNTVRPEPIPPYALSDADTVIVLRGLYSAVKDLDEPGLRNLKAVRNNGGEVYVCAVLKTEGAVAPNRHSAEPYRLVSSHLAISEGMTTLPGRY